MPISMNKKAVGIVCNSKELFLSLKRALSLFSPNVGFYFYDTSTTGSQFDLSLSRSNLRKCRLIITVACLDTKASKIIRLIHHLRSDLAWEGSFLAIVNREDEKQQLKEANIMGERTEGFRFGQLPGHAVICLPFLLTDFLDEVAKLKDMCIEVWDSLVSESLVRDISRGVNDADKSVRANNIEKALPKLQEIVYKMKQVDWLTWLQDPHKDLPLVNKFIEMYPPEHPIDKNNCFTIINNIQEILAKSFIRI